MDDDHPNTSSAMLEAVRDAPFPLQPGPIVAAGRIIDAAFEDAMAAGEGDRHKAALALIERAKQDRQLIGALVLRAAALLLMGAQEERPSGPLN